MPSERIGFGLLLFILCCTFGHASFACDCEETPVLSLDHGPKNLIKLAQVMESKTRILDVSISYGIGPFAQKVGGTELTVRTIGEEIKGADVTGSAGIFGINIPLAMSFSGQEFMTGKPIPIKLSKEKDTPSIVVIKAMEGFTSKGGTIKISYRIKDGTFRSVPLTVKLENGRHKVYQTKNGVEKPLEHIDIKVEGLGLNDVYIAESSL